jgi:two-component system cell cycle sensor histidine kinase/response regulator CckA
VRVCGARLGVVPLWCAVAFAAAQAQTPPRVVPAVPRAEAIASDSGARARQESPAARSEGLHLIFSRPSGGPPILITGWRASLIVLGFLGGLVGIVWRLLFLRRKARTLARRSERQYQALFDQNLCAMFVYDMRTSAILTANQAASTLVGHSAAAFATLTLRDLFSTHGAVDAMQTLHATSDADEDSILITRLTRADGACLDVDVRGRPLDDGEGHTRLVMVLDVTRRLTAERALRDAEQRARATSEMLRSLIDVAPQAIVAVDRQYRVTLWNHAAETLFGWPAAEVLGNALPYIPPEFEADFEARKRQVDSLGGAGPSEVTRLRKDGTRIELLAASGVVRDADGKAAGYLGIFTDLTKHRLLESQLRQSQKLEAVGRLAGGLAHDFNNLLTIITSYVEVLRAPHDAAERASHLAEIGGAAARAAALTRQLLTFSRRQVVQTSVVNVNDVVSQLEPMLRRVSAQNISLRSVLAPDLGSVLADPAQLEQMILNLAVNANDAMPDGGSLTLETANVELDADYVSTHAEVTPGSYVLLSVRDTGYGMTDETLAKIFEPFFTTKEAGRGTGLGLAITYEVVRRAGGHIWVYSEVDAGAIFRIYLPRVPMDATHLTPTKPVPVVSRGGRALLVEDDAAVRRSVRLTLERLGYAVLEAADGDSGLALAQEHGDAIDVVMTDLMMPGITGREFAERLTQAWPGLPVLFTSGYTDDEVIRRRLMREGQTFLQKPFTSEQLAVALQSLRAAG